jgi:ElaB/YqjD/DUF883 family membrane-anchored ribosome-binding protein
MDDNSLEARVIEAGEALSEGVRHATSATAAAVGRAEKVFGEAGEVVQQAAQQAWSQASGVTDDVLAAGRQAAQAASRQIDKQPVLAVIVALALGYIAALLVHGRR